MKFDEIVDSVLTEELTNSGETAGVSDTAPDGAMSSGPILDAGKDDPKSAIYTVFRKNCKGKDCEQMFDSEEEMREFLKKNNEWVSK
tara:strand:- start:1464 stop:1724 length:261 start_codon:yes stop_codon:yes gene_type:complete